MLGRSMTGLLASAVAAVAATAYFPGQDYPDREQWLSKRHTPSRTFHASMFFDSHRWGTFNPGVNNLKRKARAEWDYFRIIARELGQPHFTILRKDSSPSLHRQLMTLRRKAQQQGHVTIEPDAAAQRRKAMKDHLK